MSAPEARIVDRYAIYGEIAAGGMASVHIGRLIGGAGFNKTVAIKQLHPQFAKDQEFVSMFIDEARLAARIHHPNVVQTLDVVQHGDQLLLVMEYVHGVQLSALTRLARKSGKKIPTPIVVAIVAGMLRGLHAAHEATNEQGEPLSIVHRDVSPHNLLVSTDGVARLIDFGVAKAAGRLQQTATGQLKGKVPYMTPEQVRGQPVTRQTDVFSAGIVLWETLLTQRLFNADNDAAIVSEIIDRYIEPPSHVDVDVPVAFDAVVMRALERDPAKRFETARDMAEALEACDRVAQPAEVATWVSTIAVEQLAKRSTLVSGVESSSAIRVSVFPTVEPSSVNSQAAVSSASIPAAKPGKNVGWMFALVVALLAMGGVGYLIVRGARTPEPAPSGIAASPSSPPTPATHALTKPTSEPSASPSVAPLPSSSAKPKPKTKGVTSSAPPPPPNDCDPPYTFDANGMKKYKSHCL